jgi:tRNA 5-methylaminomethyl-2-thiouridine biosynthesis bifunctional protein
VAHPGYRLRPGLKFLAAWAAWKADPQRPRLLHFAGVEGSPLSAQDLLRATADDVELAPLARQLAAQWWGLVPGVHRLVFEGGRVLLTLAVGDTRAMLAEQAFSADSVFLDFDPQHVAAGDLPLLKAVARLCHRGTGIASSTPPSPCGVACSSAASWSTRGGPFAPG